MQRTKLGFGTWLIGAWNIRRRRGRCAGCARTEALRTFETSQFTVLAWLPLFPHGRMRVIRMCPVCGHYVAQRASLFESHKRYALADAATKYIDDPTNRALAMTLIDTAGMYEAEEEFLRFAPDLEQAFATDAEVWDRLASTYAYFEQRPAAVRAYEQSLALENNPDVRRNFGVLLLQSGQLDYAESILAQLPKQSSDSRRELGRGMAEAYQAAGRHPDAIEILSGLSSRTFKVRDDDDLERLRKLSETHESAGTRLTPDFLPTLSGGHRYTTRTRHLAKLVPLYLLFIVTVFWTLLSLACGYYQNVHVVNGLDRSYTVRVNGQELTLPPLSATAVRVGDGSVIVVPIDPVLSLPTVQGTAHRNFFLRPFIWDKAFVANPDGLAILYQQTRGYNRRHTDGDSSAHDVVTGRTYYEFDGIDYAFEHFPISLSDTQPTTKTRIDQHTATSATNRADYLRQHTDPATAERFLMRHEQLNP